MIQEYEVRAWLGHALDEWTDEQFQTFYQSVKHEHDESRWLEILEAVDAEG